MLEYGIPMYLLTLNRVKRIIASLKCPSRAKIIPKNVGGKVSCERWMLNNVILMYLSILSLNLKFKEFVHLQNFRLTRNIST